MKAENAIEVHNVTKGFKVYLDKGRTLKEKILFQNRRKYEKRTVLNDISFDVKRGEAIGLIGQNGCGKSTTLKLLTRIMYPDSGTIEMAGRVSSLIELGAGFHPDMSGRQNIYINASIFGLTRKEIDRRLDDIISFSELEEFIDNPVRTYSSGMYMRLAFSVAINVDADILLIDEILAVGDANFQAKCFNKLREIKANGTTIVIVSHSLGQIEQICERSIWIQDGEIRAEGSPYEIHPMYLDFMGQKRQEIIEKDQERKKEKEQKRENEPEVTNKISDPAENVETVTPDTSIESPQRWGNGKARITNISLTNREGKASSVYSTGEKIYINVDYLVHSTIDNATFGIGIFRSDGFQCYGTNTKIENFKKFNISKNGRFSIELENFPLLPGRYWIDIAIECQDGIPVDYFTKAVEFEIYSSTNDAGLVRVEHKWKLDILEGD